MQYDTLARSRSNHVLVMLPGRHSRGSDFKRYGFGDHAVCNLIAADAHFGYYRNQSVLERLHDDVISNLNKPIMVGGISMGGLGAAMYALTYPDDVSGLLLMAPFLADEKLVNRIEAQGLDVRNDDSSLIKRQLQVWQYLLETEKPLVVGCGESDEFAPAIRLLQNMKPDATYIWVPGGHDWPTWQEIWAQYLAQP